MIKRRRARARQMKLEEEPGNQVVKTNDWSVEDDLNDSSMKKQGNNTFMNEIDASQEPNAYQRVTVPLTITMLIIAGYIWAGSLIFNKFEGWTMIQAGYFCFITLCRRNVFSRKPMQIWIFLF